MLIKELCYFGVNKNTVYNLFKRFGLNGRLNSISIKLKHRNKIVNRSNAFKLTGKALEARILNFKSFYQRINYNKSKLKNGKSSKNPKTFLPQKTSKKKKS